MAAACLCHGSVKDVPRNAATYTMRRRDAADLRHRLSVEMVEIVPAVNYGCGVFFSVNAGGLVIQQQNEMKPFAHKMTTNGGYG